MPLYTPGGPGGGSSDASDLTSGILAPGRLQTFDRLYPVPAAMGALVLDVTKAKNTKSFSADSTLTYSATPSTGVAFGYAFTADGTDRVITLPAGTHRSIELNATITTITVPANATIYGTIVKTAAGYDISHPPTAAQSATAIGLGTTSTVQFAGEKVNVLTKSGNYTLGTGAASEAFGSVVYMTGAGTLTLPAIASGMSVIVQTVGAIAVSVDPNAADLIYLDGVALDDGDKITNTSTAGDIAILTYYSGVGWFAATNGWTDGS